ncbi:aminopeptidase [Marinobacter sp. EVN1]|uniref:aminopeptidase n=1 Tax=Marinobacter sp. EVN1 TaxID=1397532 RepID=UPI0004B191FD|nr:aminopeptidase [Marinobacter sp. EVN1]
MRQLSQIYLLLLLVTPLSGCTTIGYYGQAIGGHVSLMMKARPINQVITAPETDPELRRRLELAVRAREFAAKELALPVDDAYSEYVALGRPWVVVNLVAVPEFSLTPHQWCYPFVGCQSYRGYFRLADARQEQKVFQERDYDTFIGTVTAYSTLGWFDDPLHTGFTSLTDDRMVALMFHELAHRVLYINGDTAFNESFATAVELEGLRLWLQQQGALEGFDGALARLQHRRQALALVEDTSEKLQQLYASQNHMDRSMLRARKAQLLDELARDYANLADHYEEPGPFGPPPVQLNNAQLALFRQYNQHVPAFRQMLKELDYRFSKFYRAVEELSRQPADSRAAQLELLSERFVEHL